MTTQVLICDDSNMARKQLARCLPADWDINILFANDGEDALKVIAESSPELLFLDLNMPVMDGYQTLEAINEHMLNITVIVVSGDIQPEAQERVLNLGAIDFIKKPASKETLVETLEKSGFYESGLEIEPADDVQTVTDSEDAVEADSESILTDDRVFLDACQEVANVAMGRAGDLLARFLDEFVELPIPKVNHIELSELKMALQFSDNKQTVSSVCQGFIGTGLSGEALLLFNDSDFKNIASLTNYKGDINDTVELELLMDIANILVGACLQGISDQLDLNLSQGHPVVLGQHLSISDLINNNVKRWEKAVSIEINYQIKKKGFNCDLLILLTDECIPAFRQRLSYII